MAVRSHRVHRECDDVEETRLALGDATLGAVHERTDGLTQCPLAVPLAEHLLWREHSKPIGTMNRQSEHRRSPQNSTNTVRSEQGHSNLPF